MNRRQFLAATAATSISPLIADSLLAQATTAATSQPTTHAADDLVWHDVRDWGVEGRAFDDTESYFDRLPGRAKGVVREEVWRLSRQTAGMRVYFETGASNINVRYTLLSPTLASGNMAAPGVSGLDCYARVPDDIGSSGGWRWVGTHSPKAQTTDGALVRGLPTGSHALLVHLPLYNGLTSLEIGLPKGAAFTPVAPRTAKPIVWYGTSITQGASASRPGSAFTNILCRRLDRPIHNFGFSGNGTTELEVGRFLNEIDAAAFVIDTMANTAPHLVRERVVALVRLLRTGHPTTPIVVLEDRLWDSGPLAPSGTRSTQADRRRFLRDAINDLREAGTWGLTFVPDSPFLGDDGEATIDGSHPTDLGMMRYADALEGPLRAVLK